MSLPSHEEQVVIQKFRTKVRDVLSENQLRDDWFLIRWLRARELNLEKAEVMLRTSMKWRQENKVDRTLQEPIDNYFTLHFPFDVSGTDRQGRPLLVLPLGKWDVRMAVEDGRIDEMPTFINYFFETIMKAIRNSKSGIPGHPHTQFTAIVDWDGYSFRQFTNMKAAQNILKLSSVYEAHYPEVLHQAFFINCTSVFQMFFALMKKVLAEKTVGKIQTFGTKRTDWEPEIRKLVDLSNVRYDLKEGIDITEEEIQKIVNSTN